MTNAAQLGGCRRWGRLLGLAASDDVAERFAASERRFERAVCKLAIRIDRGCL
jgi:hypothetical protein